MSSSFGMRLKITIFGQSHSEAVGIVIDGLPAGEHINMERVQRFLERRAPGRNAYSTEKKEIFPVCFPVCSREKPAVRRSVQ